MKLLVERFDSDKDATICTIYLDNVFQCFGLEDEYREKSSIRNTHSCRFVLGGTFYCRRFLCPIRKKVFRYSSGNAVCAGRAGI